MLFIALLSLLHSAAAGPVVASSNVRPMVLHDSRPVHPQSFTQVKSAHPDQVLSLGIHLKSTDRDGLEKRVLAMSTPGNPEYGKHMSQDEVASYMKPTAETLATAKQWLTSYGLNHTSTTFSGDWMSFSVPVSKASSMLNATFNVYNHKETGEDIVRTLAYSLPEDLKPHVRTIQPTTSFFVLKRDKPFFEEVKTSASKRNERSELVARQDPCSPLITPACLQSLYGIPTFMATNANNWIGVTAFGNQYAQADDLGNFLATYRPDMQPTGYSFWSVQGGQDVQDDSQAGGEANLDMQQTVGVATGVPVTFMNTGTDGSPTGGNAMLDIINVLLGQSSVPTVLTTSYGIADEGSVGADLGNSWCDAYMQLGARGVSILFASGDSGVGGASDGSCTAFVPDFPSGCPYVTAVGATNSYGPEQAASFSSGGFSNIFGQPSWQSGAVQGYLNQLGGTNSGMFNPGGRAFPDIAAQGMNVAWVNGGQFGAIGGTSASSPIFASVIAYLNEELMNNGQSPLGYLNPWLYANAGAFTDITTGSNPGCGTNGFPALGGWDPATGLGTPIYGNMRSAAGLQ